MSLNTNEHVTIRFSRPDDAAKIARLAQLDSARPPQGRLLVAEVAGELRAALPVDGGAAVADPFHHTLGLVSLLEVRRRQIYRVGVTRTSKRRGRVARHDVQAERLLPERIASREYALPVVRELPSGEVIAMTLDLTSDGVVWRPWVRGFLVVAVVVALAAVAAVRAGDADARGTESWTRTVQLRLSPKQLGLPASTSPRRLARAALSRSAGRLRLPRSLAGVRLERDQRAPAGSAVGVKLHSLRFQQTSGGRRVLWSQIDVLVSGREVGLIRATAVPVKPGRPARRAKISRRQALAIARRAVRGNEQAHAPQLITYAGNPARGRPPRLAYVIETLPRRALRAETPAGLCVVVDARTGSVLTTWHGHAARPPRRTLTRSASAHPARVRRAIMIPGVRRGPVIALNDGRAPTSDPPVFGLQKGGPYGSWRAILPQSSLANWDTSPTLASTNVFQPSLDAAIRNTRNVVVHMCFTRDFCSRNGVRDDRWKPLQVTGAADLDDTAYFGFLQRVFLLEKASYQNDVIAHELGHHIDFIRSADDHTGSREAPEVAEGLADMFAYDFDREDATLGEDGPRGKNTEVPAIRWDAPSFGQPSRMSQYVCNPDPHFNSTILSHAYFRFVQMVGPDVAGFVLYQVPQLRGPNAAYVAVANTFVSVAATTFRESPQVASAARQAFLVEGGMDHAPPPCIPAAPPTPPAPVPTPEPTPAPPTQVMVPDVRGGTPGAASSELSVAGLRLGTQRSVVDDTCNDIGAVISQTPSAGTLVATGTAVNVTIGQRPPHPCP